MSLWLTLRAGIELEMSHTKSAALFSDNFRSCRGGLLKSNCMVKESDLMREQVQAVGARCRLNAVFASCKRAPAPAQPSTAEPDSNALSYDCAECIELKEQILAHKRTVDEITEENKRSRDASEDLEVRSFLLLVLPSMDRIECV